MTYSKKRLVGKLLEFAFLFPTHSFRAGEIGRVLKKLSAEETELCKTLNSEDFNHRIK